MKNETLKQIREAVKQIKIEKRGTPAGDKQREEFKRRWGYIPNN